jgi:hypothetical protein
LDLENLSKEEFFEVIRRIEDVYNQRIPKDVIAALFIQIVSDPQRLAFCLERRIERGKSSLKKRLASKDRELFRKIFHE